MWRVPATRRPEIPHFVRNDVPRPRLRTVAGLVFLVTPMRLIAMTVTMSMIVMTMPVRVVV
jgi:hypothetical protein